MSELTLKDIHPSGQAIFLGIRALRQPQIHDVDLPDLPETAAVSLDRIADALGYVSQQLNPEADVLPVNVYDLVLLQLYRSNEDEGASAWDHWLLSVAYMTGHLLLETELEPQDP